MGIIRLHIQVFNLKDTISIDDSSSMYVSEDSDENEEEPELQSESQNKCVVCLTTRDATWIFIPCNMQIVAQNVATLLLKRYITHIQPAGVPSGEVSNLSKLEYFSFIVSLSNVCLNELVP